MAKVWVSIKSKRGRWPLTGKPKFFPGDLFQVDDKNKDAAAAIKCHILSMEKPPVDYTPKEEPVPEPEEEIAESPNKESAEKS